MSLHATVDVVVHFHRFKNIDLYARGIYSIRTSVAVMDTGTPTETQATSKGGSAGGGGGGGSNGSEDRVKGIPYAYFSEPSSLSTFVREQEIVCDQSTLTKAHILDDISEFQSRSFVIKYRDEYLDMNEGVQFQVLVPYEVGAESPGRKLVIKFELIMAELEKPNISKNASSSTKRRSVIKERVPSDQLFTSVAVQEVVMSVNDTWSLHEYFPITFDDTHFCQIDMAVHTALMNLKFRRSAYRRSVGSKKESTASRVGRALSFQAALPASMLELLFPEGSEQALATDMTPGFVEAARAIHEEYNHTMTMAIEAVTEEFRWMWEHCLPGKLRKQTDAELGFAGLSSDATSEGASAAAPSKRSASVPPSKSLVGSRTRSASSGSVDVSEELDVAGNRLATSLLPALPDMPAGEDCIKQTSDLAGRTPQEYVVAQVELNVQKAAKYGFQVWSRFVGLLPRSNSRMLVKSRERWLRETRRWWLTRSSLELRRMQKILQGETAADLNNGAAGIRSALQASPPVPPPIYDARIFGNVDQLPVCLILKYVTYLQLQQTKATDIGELEQETKVIEDAADKASLDDSPPSSQATKFLRRSSSSASNGGRRASKDSFFGRLSIGGYTNDSAAEAAAAEAAVEAAEGTVSSSPNGEGTHLFVLHHGFHGSSYDLRLIRSYILLLFPNAMVMASQVNEDNSEASIMTMGNRLAAEIRNFVNHKCPELSNPARANRLSFVGHSVGSVVVRAALTSPLLQPFQSKMYCFISLSSPHLGNTYIPSAIVSAGIWALKRLRKAQVLDELQMLDASSPEDTVMFKLSLDRGLSYFKHVVLVSGHQDQYVPLHSSLIQVPGAAEKDIEGGPTVIAMAANLMGSLDPSKVLRINTDHFFEHITMDTMIGRAAHVSLLDSHGFILLLFFSLYAILE